MLVSKIIAALSVLGFASAQSVSSDGKCGIVRGKPVTCLKSTFGSCCSQYGWCGSTSAYCSTGCQHVFGNCNAASPSSTRQSTFSTSARSSTPAASSSVQGSSTRSSSARSSSTSPAQPVSTNARCGPKFGGKTCLGSKWGNCCSQYSYCGSTSDYCAPKKCQAGYGLCDSVPSSSSLRTSTATSSRSSSVQSSSTRVGSYSTTQSSSIASAVSSSTPVSSTVSSSSSNIASSASSSSASSSSVLSSSAAASSSVTVLSSTQSSEPAVSPTPSSTFLSSSVSSSEAISSSSSPSASSTVSATPSPSAICISQVLTNGDFETGSLDPWQTYGPIPNAYPSWSVVTEGTDSNHVYQLASSNGAAAHIRQPVNLPSGLVTFSCSFRYRVVAGSFYGSFSIYAQIGGRTCGTSSAVASEWTPVTGTLGPMVTSDNTAYLWASFGARNVQIYVDDFVISVCSPPS